MVAEPYTNPQDRSYMLEQSPRIPRYVDVANVLESEIRRLAPNSLLSTEEQLARRFGVSRVTIRSALEMLENSGLVSRLRGRGTVVSPEKITRTFSPLQSFEADMANQGIAFETQILGYKKATSPDESIRNRLMLGAGDKVGALTLLRLVEDRVICHEQRFHPPDVAKRFDPVRVQAEPCLLVLQDVIGTKITASQWESEIVPASQDVASTLGVAGRTLVFASSYTWYIKDGRPVEAGTISYRVDRCKFRFNESLSKKRRRSNGEDKTRVRQR